MNLESKLNNSLNNVLRSAGYIFEIINNNKKNSNLITGANNKLITPQVIDQLSTNLQNFEDILDETIGKFNDARWCIEQIVENKLKQEELKLKEEIEKQRLLKEEQERIQKEEEAKKKREAEEALKKKAEEERKKREEEERRVEEEKQRQKKREEEARKERELQEQQQQQQQQQQQKQQNNDLGFDSGVMMMSPSFDFNMDDITGVTSHSGEKSGIPNPSDILSSGFGGDSKDGSSNNNNATANSNNNNNNNNGSNNGNNEGNNSNSNNAAGGAGNDMDLDMNNILGNDASLLDDLNMNLLDQDMSGAEAGIGDVAEFDIDNFLHQFGGDE